MYETNVHGTANVLDAAVDAQVPRIVYVSTVNVFGNTHGEIVDETYERPGGDYVSAYDWTKHVAHEIARERIELGAPIVIVQPGAIYGPGDHSELGGQLEQARQGKLRDSSSERRRSQCRARRRRRRRHPARLRARMGSASRTFSAARSRRSTR